MKHTNPSKATSATTILATHTPAIALHDKTLGPELEAFVGGGVSEGKLPVEDGIDGIEDIRVADEEVVMLLPTVDAVTVDIV